MDAASHDSLTGCLSRGAFQERLEHESMRARRHHSTFSLIVADVDDLKAHNDSSGHHSGDRALRLLAGVLCQAARETDVVGRLGGDEFAMLLPETDHEAGLRAATRMNEALHDVTGSDSVTASLGVSTWLGSDDGPDALLRRADEALYAAETGRSRPRRGLGAAVVGGPGRAAMARTPPAAHRREVPGLVDPAAGMVRGDAVT